MSRTTPFPGYLLLAAAVVAMGSCKGPEEQCDPTSPLCATETPPVAAVEVTSPIGTVMAADRTAQMSAAATDAEGNPVTATFTWTSTTTSTATVNGSGLVSGLAAGTTNIRASAEGVTGSLGISVVNADLDGIAALLDDPFVGAASGALDAATASTIDGHLTACSTNVTSGNILAVEACLADALNTGEANGTDTALLGVLALFFEQAQRLLGT